MIRSTSSVPATASSANRAFTAVSSCPQPDPGDQTHRRALNLGSAIARDHLTRRPGGHSRVCRDQDAPAQMKADRDGHRDLRNLGMTALGQSAWTCPKTNRGLLFPGAPEVGQLLDVGGEEGIRTPDTGFSPYNGLANRRLQPLGHLTARDAKYTTGLADFRGPRSPYRLSLKLSLSATPSVVRAGRASSVSAFQPLYGTRPFAADQSTTQLVSA